MRIINFSVPVNEIQIVPLADLHIGSPQSDEVLIKEVTDYIAKTPNCYTILNGDIMDNNTRTSIGSGVYFQTMNPVEQVTRAAYYLREIAQQGKIINMLSGNHELRTEKETGLSLSDLLLAKLMQYDETLNERYCADGAFTFINIQARTNTTLSFTMYNLHGNGSGAKIGGKIQRLEDMSQIVSANVFVRAHTHIPETHRGVIMHVDTNAHTVREEPCVYVNCGSYLKYGGYGERGGMKPLSRAIPVITLKAKRCFYKKKDYYTKIIECTLKERIGD